MTIIILFHNPGLEEKDGCFAFEVLLLVCGCLCSSVSPGGAVGWSAMCDCGFSWSYSRFVAHNMLTFQ